MWWVMLICLSPVLFIVGWLTYYLFLDPSLDPKKTRATAESLVEVLESLKCPHCDHSLSHRGFQLHHSDDFKPTADNMFDILTIECDGCGLESTFKLDAIHKTVEVGPAAK